MDNNIVINLQRNNITEKSYLGSVIALNKDGDIVVEFNNNIERNIVFRSMQKPFQAYNFLLSGAYKKFELNKKHLAVISGSHAGTEKQVALVKEILKKSGLKESDLQCPKDYPLDEKTKNNLIKSGKRKARVYDNCSGKHAGMLSSCVAQSMNIDDYMNSCHPLQRQIIKRTLKLCEFDSEIIATDGCGVPVLAMPILNMAKGLQNLYKTDKGKLIMESAIKYPMLFGGNNRFDTDIIKMTKGKIFAKVGACGLVGALNLKTQEALVVKIFADDHPARAEVTINYMKELGWI